MRSDYPARIINAWRGRVSGCMLGKAVEVFSMREGQAALHAYLSAAGALPLRDYVPFAAAHASKHMFSACCKGRLDQSHPDDDINYSVLALLLLEQHGAQLTTVDVARAWLKYLPVASTYTAERAAYRTLLKEGHEWFAEGHEPGFDLARCADNPYNDWIGAQIRADLYGWVAPGNPQLAAQLATADAALSHQGDGIYGAVIIAVIGSLLADGITIEAAIAEALNFIPKESAAAAAVHLGLAQVSQADGAAAIRAHYPELSPVHTLNNLALVIWALAAHRDDFSAAIGEVVAAGLDTDCNGATVGALWALQGQEVPAAWFEPWGDRVHTSLAGIGPATTRELAERTVQVAQHLQNRSSR